MDKVGRFILSGLFGKGERKQTSDLAQRFGSPKTKYRNALDYLFD